MLASYLVELKHCNMQQNTGDPRAKQEMLDEDYLNAADKCTHALQYRGKAGAQQVWEGWLSRLGWIY